MKLDLKYLGESTVRRTAGAAEVRLSPNLARDKTFFDAELKEPLRFREAMSVLHGVVTGDHKQKRRTQASRDTYLAWKAERTREDNELRLALHRVETERELTREKEKKPANLDSDFRKLHRLYWDARIKWSYELQQNDPELFRHLVPCDPVVTVAPDTVFFEGFAKDESSYGCLFVSRDAFGASDLGLGTTNVDYSAALFEHFQTLRTYRATRLLVDPAGFTVDVSGSAAYREEKIDLPPSWLRGFGQLQAAMALPARNVELSVDAVYSLLAFLKRNREKGSPRSLRFVLEPGRPARVIVEPWGVEIVSRGKPYDGGEREEVRVWGRRRLESFARALPLTHRFEVRLLGSGLPSVWVAHMGEMRFVLALSGWSANDWTSGSNLDQHFARFVADETVASTLEAYLLTARSAPLAELAKQVTAPEKTVLGSLHLLAKRGQIVYDFAADLYRYRPVMPVALSEDMLGPEPPEAANGKRLARERKVVLDRVTPAGRPGDTLYTATVDGARCEGIMNRDGVFSGAKCGCSHFFRFKLRAGPCRHLIALRTVALGMHRDEPAAAPHVAATRATKSQLFRLGDDVLGEMNEEAERRRCALPTIAEQAWKIARDEVLLLAEVPAGADGRSAARKAPQTFELSAAVLEEIERVAARLDVSVGAVLEIAWQAAKETMRLTSSLVFK